MAFTDKIPLATWLAYFRAMRVYHRYEVEGIEILDRPGAALLVGYHGKPWADDMCMLTVSLYERLGYMPHGVAHSAFGRGSIGQWVMDGLGFVTGDGEGIAAAVARGEHILVQPGGTREGYRSSLHRYQVDWGDRTGYLRLALRYNLPIVPVAARGIDDGFLGLNNGYTLAKRLRVPYGLPVWLGFGPLGLFPISPPFPVKIKQVIGEPIHLREDGPVDPTDRPALLRLHRRVTGVVQDLLDRANA